MMGAEAQVLMGGGLAPLIFVKYGRPETAGQLYGCFT